MFQVGIYFLCLNVTGFFSYKLDLPACARRYGGDDGIFFLQSRGHGGRGAPCPTFSFIPGPVADDPEYVFRILMEPVIAPFVIDPEEDEKTEGEESLEEGKQQLEGMKEEGKKKLDNLME